MGRKKIEESVEVKCKKMFHKELQAIVGLKLDEINHYISGCDSPFTYLQIAEVQEHLLEIANTLGIKSDSEVKNGND